MYAIYEQDNTQLNLFEDEEEKGMSLVEAEERLRRIKQEEPEEFERIVNLRDGIRTGFPIVRKAPSYFVGQEPINNLVYMMKRETDYQ